MLGENIWLGNVGSIFAMDQATYEAHCRDVMKAIYFSDPSEARKLKLDLTEFEDPDWQYDWMIRQYTLMGDYVESHCKGQAEIEMVNYAGDMRDLRKHLYKQFGSGSGGNIHEEELDFDRGMPEKGKAAFPPGCNMGEKLRQLESKRLYFMRMAGSTEKRRTYTYCQETKLVRIVLEHVNKAEYGDCVKRVLEIVKVRKMVAKAMSGDSSDDDGGVPDNHERSFSDDWLPSWKLLKSSLLDEWIMRSSQEGNAKEKVKNVLPIALNGVGSITCWGCGGPHKKGDPECKAGKFDAHHSAPAVYKARMEKKRKVDKANGDKAQGNRVPNKKGKRDGKEKKHCKAFNFGKGNCRYGDKCKFLHEKRSSGLKDGEFSPKQEKIVSAMVASAVKKTAILIAKKNKKEKQKKNKAVQFEKDSDTDSVDYASMLASVCLAPIRNTIPRELVSTIGSIVMKANLHNVDKNCGIDSDAGISISTIKSDFPLWIDDTEAARDSIAAPTGISGGTSRIGGRGPMVIRTRTGEYLIDPDAVYLESNNEQPNFRVMSTQRLKLHGVRLVGCFDDTEVDVLQDRVSKRTINLSEDGPKGNKILVVETIACQPFHNLSQMREIVKEIRKRNRSAMLVIEDDKKVQSGKPDPDEEVDIGIMAFNIAKCNDEERSRLYSRRFGYCNPELLLRMNKDDDYGNLPKFGKINEDNHVMDLTKFKKKAHTRNDPDISMGRPP
jgi:hypothetical protein